jgi:hypothetical protein
MDGDNFLLPAKNGASTCFVAGRRKIISEKNGPKKVIA